MPRLALVPPQLSGRPFSVAEARDAGLTMANLRSDRLRLLRRGVYIASSVVDSFDLEVDAARLVLPGEAAFSHEAAARLHGLPLPRGARPSIHVTVPSDGERVRLDGVTVHRRHDAEVINLAGRLVTSLTSTFVDLAVQPAGAWRHWTLGDLVALGDAVVRRGSATPQQLLSAVDYRPGAPRRAREAAELVVDRVDSPNERYCRLILKLSDLPSPIVNEPVREPDAGIAWTPDLLYAIQRIALECQGDQHRTDRWQWQHDITRLGRLRDAGYFLFELTADPVYRTPRLTVERVHRQLVLRRHPDVPRAPTDGWRRAFQ